MRVGLRVAMVAIVFASFVFVAPPALAGAMHTYCGADHTFLLGWGVVDLHHDGKAYDVAICMTVDQTFTNNYVSSRIRFDDNGDTALRNQNNVAERIEIDYIRLWRGENRGDRTLFVAKCDQTNDWTGGSQDGGGCNHGDYSGGNGPCSGMRIITSHAMAFGSHGCTNVDGRGIWRSTNLSQTDKYHDPAGDDWYVSELKYRVRWSDGSNSLWHTSTVYGNL